MSNRSLWNQSKALRYTVIIGTVAVITISMMVYVHQTMLNTYSRNIAYVNLGESVKSRVLSGYLEFEQLLSGNTRRNFNNGVMKQFTASKALLQTAYDGGESELGTFEKATDENLRVQLKEAIVGLDKLIEESVQRNTLAASGSTGSQDLNATFENFQAAVDKLVGLARQRANEEGSNLSMISWTSTGIVALCFVAIGFFIYRMQASADVHELAVATKLEDETNRVGTLTTFIESVSAGNYDLELHQSSDQDNLTHTLITMRDKLKKNAEDDRKRNWSTTGLAQIGEILRATTTTSGELFDNIIRFVVKYTKSNQGGLFILNENDENSKYLELVACYAFERKKFLTKRVELGSGLVGQCYLEGERIYLLEVPQEYISITSGLGGSNPSALLLVPLKVNDEIFGVLELASFKAYEEYEIQLVEKLAESIASTIANVRVNETTRVLLAKTQQQAEEMRSQEEEIRQNMEELEATQEEMRRKQSILEKELVQSQEQAEALKLQEKKLTESQDTLQAIVDNIPRAIFWKDKDLRFMGCNRIFAQIAGASSPVELIGKTDFDMAWSAQADAYRQDDTEVMRKRKAKLDIEEVNINSEGEESWVLTSKVPIINHHGDVVAILGMFEDITARKKKEAEVARKLEEREHAMKELTALKQLLEARKG